MSIDDNELSEQLRMLVEAVPSVSVRDALAEPGYQIQREQDRSDPRWSRRMRLNAALTAFVLVTGLVSVIALIQRPVQNGVTTGWKPARELPATFGLQIALTPGKWQLASDIIPIGWRLHTTGPVLGWLSCPSSTTCYATGERETSHRHGPPDLASFYASRDGGLIWSVLPLPNGFGFTAPISCTGKNACAGGGELSGHSAFVTTSDGGHEWHISMLANPKAFVALACISISTCDGILAPAGGTLHLTTIGPDERADEDFARTSNAGASWSLRALPPADSVDEISCPSERRCIVAGVTVDRNSAGFIMSTTTNGAHWTVGTHSQNLGFDTALSCGTASFCVAAGASPSALVSHDGGVSWRTVELPRNTDMLAVSCRGPFICWGGGQQRRRQDGNDAQSVVLATRDGGATWTPSTFAIPPSTPAAERKVENLVITKISCSNTTSCVALGLSWPTLSQITVYVLSGRTRSDGT